MFRPDLLRAYDLVLEGALNFRYFPVLRIIRNWTPPSVMAALDHKVAKFLELRSVRRFQDQGLAVC